VVYGLAIPSYFFYIVHTHREEVKSGPYLQKYGFLTAKFSERFYGANATTASMHRLCKISHFPKTS
jgi:Tfp pilus assembly protein PilE